MISIILYDSLGGITEIDLKEAACVDD